jgi:hypothetical protein
MNGSGRDGKTEAVWCPLRSAFENLPLAREADVPEFADDLEEFKILGDVVEAFEKRRVFVR